MHVTATCKSFIAISRKVLVDVFKEGSVNNLDFCFTNDWVKMMLTDERSVSGHRCDSSVDIGFSSLIYFIDVKYVLSLHKFTDI